MYDMYMPKKSYVYKGGKRRVSRHMAPMDRVAHHAGQRFGNLLFGVRCLGWTASTDRKGYPHLTIAGVKMVSVARLVLANRLGRPMKPGMQALHHCDHAGCIEPKHLYEGTHDQNVQDMLVRGRTPVGVQRWNAKLTKAKLLKARHLRTTTSLPMREIAKQLGVSRPTLSRALSGKTWKHV